MSLARELLRFREYSAVIARLKAPVVWAGAGNENMMSHITAIFSKALICFKEWLS
jgi:hypothetical protein